MNDATRTELEPTMTELKSCPFCGGKAWIAANAIIVNGKVTYADYEVRHPCDVFGSMTSRNYETEADAIAAWNRRVES